MITVMLKMNN